MYQDSSGEWIHIVIGALVGAVVGGAIDALSQKLTTGTVDWGQVVISSLGGAVSGGFTAAGFGPVASAIISGGTDLSTQLYNNGFDFTQIDVTEVLISSAIGAIGAKAGGNAGNTGHLDSMGKNCLKRIGKTLSGTNFTPCYSISKSGKEIKKAITYYFSQTSKDNTKVIKSVIKSNVPVMVKSGSDVYVVKVVLN